MKSNKIVNIPADGLNEGWKDVFGRVGQKVGNALAAFPGAGRAGSKAYTKAKAAVGGGYKDVNQIAQTVSMLDKTQAKAVVDYIDDVIMKQRGSNVGFGAGGYKGPKPPEKKQSDTQTPQTTNEEKSLYEGLTDFMQDVTGSNRMSMYGYDPETAGQAEFEKQFATKALRTLRAAWKNQTIDLGKAGTSDAAQAASSFAQPSGSNVQLSSDILRNSVFVRSLESLKDDELQLVRDVAAKRAGIATAAADQQAATTAQAAEPAQAATTAQAAEPAQAATPAAKATPKNSAANNARVQKDIQTINSAITGITKDIKTNLLPADKARLARELVNVMADNKKARPEAWQNAYGTVKKVLQNVGSEIDFTLPKGKQNVAKDLIAALNAGQTRNQLATGINAQPTTQKRTAKSSTASRLGKAGTQVGPKVAPAQAKPGQSFIPDYMRSKVAEERTLDNIDLYFLNKFLAELDLSWNDIGYVLLETQSSDRYMLKDTKVLEFEKLYEHAMTEDTEFNPEGYAPADVMLDFINKQLKPMKLDDMPRQKLAIMKALQKWEDAFADQVEKKGDFKGTFDPTTQKAFDDIVELVSSIAYANYKSTGGRSSIYDL